MQLKDTEHFKIGLNRDDTPADLQPGEYTEALNVRTLSSAAQKESGLAETLQSEIEILINGVADITYYGESIGGSFIYHGFSETIIGTQTWMKCNYDVEYPGSKAYDDNELNVPLYGRLYQHGQVMASNFCPPGWRVPTEADIDTLLTYLGGAMIAGGKLKEAGEQDWTTPNTGAVDSAGFRALPGGKFDLLFDLLGDNCLLWLQDEAEPVAPVAIAATEVDVTSFLANWEAVIGADGYYLDVATDAIFTAFVAGFNNKDVGKVLSYPVTGLSPLTPYYYRLRAYNEIGSSGNSNTITNTTLDGVTDADGNIYTYVTIGTQQWMVENFRSEHYADGTAIPNLTLGADWIADATGAMCYYDNDEATYKPDYGALYNWYAVDNAHGLAPAGWRVPSNADFATLVAFLGGDPSVTGGKLKEIGLTHWLTPNTGATDEYGFKALPGGYRDEFAVFRQIHEVANIGGSTTYSGFPSYSDCLILFSNWITIALSAAHKKQGESVRLMRDVI